MNKSQITAALTAQAITFAPEATEAELLLLLQNAAMAEIKATKSNYGSPKEFNSVAQALLNRPSSEIVAALRGFHTRLYTNASKPLDKPQFFGSIAVEESISKLPVQIKFIDVLNLAEINGALALAIMPIKKYFDTLSGQLLESNPKHPEWVAESNTAWASNPFPVVVAIGKKESATIDGEKRDFVRISLKSK